MGRYSDVGSDLFSDVEAYDYDPLADDGLIDEEEEEEGLDGPADAQGQDGPNLEVQAKDLFVQPKPDKPADERIEDLFRSMASRRRVLLGILRCLDEPKRSDVLDEQVKELQECDFSVYNGYEYSTLLARAGAIRKVEEDGSDFDEESEQAPDIVEVDGALFYKPTDGKQVFWVVSDEGRAYLEKDDPAGRLQEVLEVESLYKPIYLRLLEYCDVEEGRSVDELNAIVNDDPLVQSPRKHCSHFTKKLEDCDALVWKKTWRTTDLGREAAAKLRAELDEAPVDAGKEE